MVEIAPYDPRWPLEFSAIGIALRGALGDYALRIDHIGSTAVPGLAAKARIDIQIAIASFERFDEIRPRVEALGYLLGPRITADHQCAVQLRALRPAPRLGEPKPVLPDPLLQRV